MDASSKEEGVVLMAGFVLATAVRLLCLHLN